MCFSLLEWATFDGLLLERDDEHVVSKDLAHTKWTLWSGVNRPNQANIYNNGPGLEIAITKRKEKNRIRIENCDHHPAPDVNTVQ